MKIIKVVKLHFSHISATFFSYAVISLSFALHDFTSLDLMKNSEESLLCVPLN